MKFCLSLFRRREERLLGLGGPSLYWMLLFFVLPMSIMALISFAQRSPYGEIRYRWGWTEYTAAVHWAGSIPGYIQYLFQNYVRACDPLYLKIYLRSIVLALVTTGLCLIIGYPVAYFIAITSSRRWNTYLLAMVVIPFWTNFLVRIYAWTLLLQNDGLVNIALLKLQHLLASAHLGFLAGLLQPPYSLLYNDAAVLVGLVYGELPFMILPLYASIQKLDRTLLEASADLGASPLTGFLRITLPLTWPGILAGVTFVFVPSIGAFIIPDLLGGSKSIMVGNLIQNQFSGTRDMPFGAAICFLMTVMMIGFLVAVSRRGAPADGGH
jgi:spermidine/putrescine transport system permease protein